MKSCLWLITFYVLVLSLLAGPANARSTTKPASNRELIVNNSVNSLSVAVVSGGTPLGITTRVSVATNGTQGNGISRKASISADGRYIAFESFADNLVYGDTNSSADIFIHDLQTGQTNRVSVATDGTQGNGNSQRPSISADGRYVAFYSEASNLVPNDTNGWDIFIHDFQTGQTSRASVASDGTEGNSHSDEPSISADGRYVAFMSGASNLVPNDTNNAYDIFVHDQLTGQTSRVSVASDGTQGNDGSSWSTSISSDGRYVAFWSDASNLVPGDTNGFPDAFVHDRLIGETSRVSVASDGTQGNRESYPPSISADGRYVTFESYANNLVSGDTNGYPDIFVHDLLTGQTNRVSVSSNGEQGFSSSRLPSISADGHYVAFMSAASNLVPDDTNNVWDVFIHELQTGQTNRISVASDGTQGNLRSIGWYPPSISANTRYIAFESEASNFASDDSNDLLDIFVHDREGGEICSQANPSRQPLLLITGWSGSVNQTLSQDDQLKYFIDFNSADNLIGHLTPYGYIEGCNLFYAADTSPYRFLYNDALSMDGHSNATIIRDSLCTAFTRVKEFNPSWGGHFDIIAHSYGGLRARAYLERANLYGQVCPGTQNRVYIDNLFTMGTPHGGEPYPSGLPGDMLPFASVIGLGAVIDTEFPALHEMLPQTRLVQNLSHTQPDDICYYLLSGDARLQSNEFPWKLRLLILPFLDTFSTFNDLAVHNDSATILINTVPLNWLYPNSIPIHTNDLHGHAPEDKIGNHNLQSFVNPNTTFVEEILPHIGQLDCSPPSSWSIASPTQIQTPSKLLGQQTGAQTTLGIAMVDIVAGSLVDSESVSGDFTLNGTGTSQIRLSWLSGDLRLSLIDPDGNEINPTTAEADTNIDFLNMDTGLGLMATYLITDTLSGTWQYTITGNAVNPATAYSLIALPPTPISVSPSLPQWLPNSTPTVITATVSYSNTMPVTGGAVSVQITQPDGITDTISLLDDGAHSDGLANDGIFGVVYPQTSKGGIYGLLFTATGLYESEVYTRTATAYLTIAPSGASLNDSYSDLGVDDTGNGIYEWLEVSADISVTEAATYTLSADLYAGTTYITHAYKQVYSDAGQQSIAVLFNGSAIFNQGLNGPYTVRNVMLLDETSVTLLIEEADEVHTTQAYQYTDFGRFLIYLPAILR